jgi:hypothetical protein
MAASTLGKNLRLSGFAEREEHDGWQKIPVVMTPKKKLPS